MVLQHGQHWRPGDCAGITAATAASSTRRRTQMTCGSSLGTSAATAPGVSRKRRSSARPCPWSCRRQDIRMECHRVLRRLACSGARDRTEYFRDMVTPHFGTNRPVRRMRICANTNRRTLAERRGDLVVEHRVDEPSQHLPGLPAGALRILGGGDGHGGLVECADQHVGQRSHWLTSQLAGPHRLGE